jgi:hypothetical protein
MEDDYALDDGSDAMADHPNALLTKVIDAYGGLDRWNGFTSLSARVRAGGAIWAVKGVDAPADEVVTRIDLHRQFTSTAPFGGPGLRSAFTPDRVAIETDTGEVVQERQDPRAAFAGHHMDTPWDGLHVAYFNGYAMWIYLTEPFSLAGAGFEVEELEPWEENGETWRRLRVVFPEEIATHSRENVYYVDDSGLVRRHDYVAEVLGAEATTAAHYVSGHREFDGIIVPTTRRILPVDEKGNALAEPVLVSIDLSDVRFE